MKKYEIMYIIIKPNLESEQIKQIIDRLHKFFLDQKAEIIEYKGWFERIGL